MDLGDILHLLLRPHQGRDISDPLIPLLRPRSQGRRARLQRETDHNRRTTTPRTIDNTLNMQQQLTTLSYIIKIV